MPLRDMRATNLSNRLAALERHGLQFTLNISGSHSMFS